MNDKSLLLTDASLEAGLNDLIVTLRNGFEIHFKTDDGYLLGIGAVRYRGTDLRNPDYTIRPSFKSIDGMAFEKFKLVDVRETGGRVEVVTESVPTPLTELEWQDFFNHEMVAMPRPDKLDAPAEMVWEVGECEQEIHGKTVPGFYYRFHLDTDSEFHCYIEQGTWEIERLARPVTVIAQRAGSVPWEKTLGPRDSIHTHESINFSRDGGRNSESQIREGLTTPDETIVWQMMPRASGSQTFDFQTTPEGWIALYNPVPAYIQTCMRKEEGRAAIAHIERHYFPRRRGVESGRKVVLAHFPEGGVTLEQTRDDWSDVFDTVNDLWRAHFNYPEDTPDTAYSPTMWARVLERNPLSYAKVVDWIPFLAKSGVKRLYTGIWWKSHFTEQVEDHNICHVLEYDKSEKHGGNALLRQMCDVAHEHGMDVYVWVIGAISRVSPMHRDHPEWICYDRNSLPTASPVHPQLYCMDYNTGWADYFTERVLALREECGFDGIFIDSYHNLNFQPINYADPELRTNMPGLIAWQRRMREAGLGIMVESQGIFGTSLNWLDRGTVQTEGNTGVEHTFYKSMVCIKTQWIENGRIDEAFCYRATANKAPVRLETDFSNIEDVRLPTHVWDGFLARINHDYHSVRDRMIRRRTLDRDRGVEWLNGDRSRVLALFSFADSAYAPPPGARIYDVTDCRDVEVVDGVANVRRFHTYRID